MMILKISKIGQLSFILYLMSLIMVSCSDKVDFGEQYKKTVYIVNSNDLLYVGEHSFEKKNDSIAISVYCASSKPITQDVKVRMKIDRHALDSLNTLQALAAPSYINKVMLPEENYGIKDELFVTIEAGKQYGVLYIPFDYTGLDSSIPFALPVSLVSNNAEYDISPTLKSIVYQIEMVNQYAGEYNGSSQTSPASILGIQPKLKALSVDKVRMPIHNLSDREEYLLTNFMVLTIDGDNNVSITPWGIADVADLGGSKYDPETQSFELYYQFTDESAKRLNVTSVIRNINAPITEEEL